MGNVIQLPLPGIDFGQRALNQIARVTIAARWLNSLPRHGQQWLVARRQAELLYNRLSRLNEALLMIEQDADWLLDRLDVNDGLIYRTPYVVAFLKPRGRTVMIENFIAAGLENVLSRVDALAARSAGRRASLWSLRRPKRLN